MAILDQNHGLTSFEKEFFVLEYRKRDFPCLYCLKKKFGKMSIFGLFELLVFIA